MTDTTPDTAYQTYKASPSPENLYGVVKTLSPTINYSLASVNATNDPVVRSHAELYAAKAIKSYDPEHAAGASLSTHVGHQLLQLSRTARASRSPVKIPERVQLEAYKMTQAKQRYADEFGREPDTIELADYTGVPIKKLKKLEQFQYSIPSEAAFDGAVTEEKPDFGQEALDYVYHGADHIDRKILEHKIGYGGGKPLPPQEVAMKLKLTPSQLSRRAMRLAFKVQELQDALERV